MEIRLDDAIAAFNPAKRIKEKTIVVLGCAAKRTKLSVPVERVVRRRSCVMAAARALTLEVPARRADARQVEAMNRRVRLTVGLGHQ